ncbi:MAG: hypothetical protein ACHQHN_19930, partial [Sphingobacteriales bacterium]
MPQDTITLKSLYLSIQTQIESGQGTFNLVPDVLNTDNIGTFYSSIVIGGTLSITNAALQPATWSDSLNEFTLSGNSDSFGEGNMLVSFIFSNTEVGLLSDLTATLHDGSWSIDGIDWFSLSNPFIGVKVYESDMPIVGSTGGTINTGVSLTVQMSYPVVNNTWLFQGNFNSPYPGISNFFQLVGGVNLTAALPQPFSTLTDLGLKEIDIMYDTVASSVNYISINISTAPTYVWQILPKLAITNIGITSTVTNPGNSKTRAVSFNITGSFTIGASGANNLVLTATVPNFSASAQLISGTIQLGDLISMFWSGTSINLKSEITAFNLQIAPTQKNYSLDCGITSDWTFFTIQSPSLSFTMTGLLLGVSSQQGAISGKITGTFHIGPT